MAQSPKVKPVSDRPGNWPNSLLPRTSFATPSTSGLGGWPWTSQDLETTNPGAPFVNDHPVTPPVIPQIPRPDNRFQQGMDGPALQAAVRAGIVKNQAWFKGLQGRLLTWRRGGNPPTGNPLEGTSGGLKTSR